MLSKKDYIAIAEIIRLRKIGESEAGNSAIMSVVSGLADYFKQDNTNFDQEKFYQAINK